LFVCAEKGRLRLRRRWRTEKVEKKAKKIPKTNTHRRNELLPYYYYNIFIILNVIIYSIPFLLLWYYDVYRLLQLV